MACSVVPLQENTSEKSSLFMINLSSPPFIILPEFSAYGMIEKYRLIDPAERKQ